MLRPLLVLFLFALGLRAAELVRIDACELVPTDWADGDSFLVRTPDGQEHTVRLYGADCIEWHIGDESDARRLRAQRRYFGISDHGGSAQASIDAAKSFGEKAAERRTELLGKPFTLITSFADARGDGRHKRIYGFVRTSSGDDLATVLVREGLARAFGVYRQTPEGLSKDDWQQELADHELAAASRRLGVWKLTDWEKLPAERRAEREDLAQLRGAIDDAAEPEAESIDLNQAARDELMRLPGIGEKTANAIIEHREEKPFTTIDELDEIPGIGPATLERIRPFLTVSREP
ncbi:MAG: helix-hairpin-helix domain-containing protein [Akkermansiaceae bacterium]|nr:helix-hairpin-helix domain-containing protein [Akkermansiaceae bacterium]